MIQTRNSTNSIQHIIFFGHLVLKPIFQYSFNLVLDHQENTEI
jgi:hypothetical protein